MPLGHHPERPGTTEGRAPPDAARLALDGLELGAWEALIVVLDTPA